MIKQVMRWGSRMPLLAAIVSLSIFTARPAMPLAQEFVEVTDRDFGLDLYSGNAIGSNEIVSMGGAAAAIAKGSAGMANNPAAPAIRSQTSTGKWDWDVHIDWLGQVSGNDIDNNGIEDDVSELNPQFTVGAVGIYKQWGLGISVATQSFASVGPAQSTLTLESSAVQLHVARTFFADSLVVGGGVKASNFKVKSDARDVFRITGASLETGVVWMPTMRNLRIGGSLSLPATGRDIAVSDCDPTDCFGLLLPERILTPWSATAGVGLRIAGTAWNQRVAQRFVDERELIVALDVRLTGSVNDGFGIDQFSKGRLQPSGDRVAISGRIGAEYEWFPGRLRLRGGSYWEPSRFRNPDGSAVGGRLHATAGADFRFWQFRLWSRAYRVRFSATIDGARNYVNGGLSIGFWR